MMIYMVVAHNGWGYGDEWSWNVAAFASKESAQRFIQNFPSEIRKGEDRIYALEELSDSVGLTDEQNKELTELHDKYKPYWRFERGYFEVEEHELLE